MSDGLVDILLIGWWWGNLESASSTFRFQPVWSLPACGWHTSFIWWEFQYLQNSSKDTAQNIISSPWGGTKVLDLVGWLNCYYFVLLNCFPSFLHFLTSLIQFILWRKFFYRQKAEDMGGSVLGKPTRVLLCFNITEIKSTLLSQFMYPWYRCYSLRDTRLFSYFYSI